VSERVSHLLLARLPLGASCVGCGEGHQAEQRDAAYESHHRAGRNTRPAAGARLLLLHRHGVQHRVCLQLLAPLVDVPAATGKEQQSAEHAACDDPAFGGGGQSCDT